jgi:opacity protein-like surface antigen
MKRIIIPTLTALLLRNTANAFDDNKEGFILGLGIGASSIKTTYTRGDSRDTGFATSLKLGYGFNRQTIMYLGAIGDAYKYDDKGKTVNTALTGIGLDYYINQNSPFYITAMVGVGSVSELKNTKIQTGYGFLVGAGYEISEHITLQADYMKINTDDKLNADTDAIRFTINYTWY